MAAKGKKGGSKISKDLSNLWKDVRREFNALSGKANRLMARGEKYLKRVPAEAREKSDALVMRAKREQLYYNLGKAVANRDTRKIMLLRNKISTLSRKINV
ncbi:MAG: hypothetical protein PHR44_05380 [Candidatus Omnitrophica bacterium]|nr:hypothetical protein [Candidatus Omnitrophota bacterium]